MTNTKPESASRYRWNKGRYVHGPDGLVIEVSFPDPNFNAVHARLLCDALNSASQRETEREQERAVKVRVGDGALTRDLAWCECGRGLCLSGKWSYCPRCGGKIDQDSYQAEISTAAARNPVPAARFDYEDLIERAAQLQTLERQLDERTNDWATATRLHHETMAERDAVREQVEAVTRERDSIRQNNSILYEECKNLEREAETLRTALRHVAGQRHETCPTGCDCSWCTADAALLPQRR